MDYVADAHNAATSRTDEFDNLLLDKTVAVQLFRKCIEHLRKY